MADLHEGIVGVTASVNDGASVDIQPPVGEEWIITSLGVSGAKPMSQCARVQLFGSGTAVTARNGHSTAAPLSKQWEKPMRFGLRNGMYLRLENNGGDGIARTFYYGGTCIGVGLTGVGDLKSGIALCGAGSYVTVQPPGNEDWALYEVAIDTVAWNAGSPPTPNRPLIEVRLWNGATEMTVGRGSDDTLFIPLRTVINNSVYLRIYNMDASSRYIGYVCQRMF